MMWEILFGWRKASRCKKLIRCVRCRLKLLRSKRDAIAQHVRSDIAELLRSGHQQHAFFRAEQLLQDQSILAVYDLLDHYCEFLLINLPYIRKHRDCPNDIKEAMSSLIFAAARCADLPELQTLRELFGKRYGNDFVMAAGECFPGSLVNQQITENLCTKGVSDDEKFELIEEIAVEYDIQLWQPEIADGCNQQYQTVDIVEGLACDPTCEQGFDVLEKDIQVVYSDNSRAEMQASNDEEMLNARRRKHAEKSFSLKTGASSHNSSSKSEEVAANSCQSHSNSESTINLVSAATEHVHINSPTIHRKPDAGKMPETSEPHVEVESSQGTSGTTKLLHNEAQGATSTSTESSTQLLESIIVCLDDLDEFHRNKQAKKKCRDRKCLEIEKAQKPHKSKNAAGRKSFQSGIEFERVGRHKEGRRGDSYDAHHCRNSNSHTAILLDAADGDLLTKHMKLIRLQNEISSAHRSIKRRKSVDQISKKRSITVQSQQFAGSGYEFDDFLGTSGSLSPDSHFHTSTRPVAYFVEDVECALYYDEACDCSDANPPKVRREKTKERSVHFISRSHDLTKKKNWREISNGGSGDSILRSQNAKKPPSPQQSNFHSKKKPVKEIRNHNESHRCNDARRSYSGHKCHHGTFIDCSLDHPCYFLTSDEKDDRPSPSKDRVLSGKRACNFQLDKDSCRFHHTYQDVSDCAATSCSKTSISSAADVGNDKQDSPSLPLHQKQRANLDSNLEFHTDIKHRTSFHGIVNARAEISQHNGMQMKEAAQPSEHATKASCLSSNSREAQTLSLRPPYQRSMTMPLQGRSKITTTVQNIRYSSFQFKQDNKPSGHVHPKLPDYDDLAAKFTALKKEHLQQNAVPQVGYA